MDLLGSGGGRGEAEEGASGQGGEDTGDQSRTSGCGPVGDSIG
jgi:hypothetical protein